MDKYTLFRKIMDLVGDDYDVTYAHMSDGFGGCDISVEGKNGPMSIDITVRLKEEEGENA